MTRPLGAPRARIPRIHLDAGFSLIELMIVVAIIGVLSTIAVPNMADGIKKNLARNHMQSFVSSLKALRITDQGTLPLIQFTGTPCTPCVGGVSVSPGTDMRGYQPNAAYIASWQKLGFDQPPRDPWGHYYLFDENDEEVGQGPCRMDTIWSAGADGIWEGTGDGDDVGGDDIAVRIPWANKTNCSFDPITGGY